MAGYVPVCTFSISMYRARVNEVRRHTSPAAVFVTKRADDRGALLALPPDLAPRSPRRGRDS